MIDDNNQDRSQPEGQEGIDRETELRNRENETGQAQNQQFGQDSPSRDRPRQGQHHFVRTHRPDRRRGRLGRGELGKLRRLGQ